METLTIQPHNQKAAATWSAGGSGYDRISRSISDAIAHCVVRLDARPGQRVLDVATGTGWAARLLAEQGAQVTGVDIGADLIAAAKTQAAGLPIDFQVGDAEALAFPDASFDAVISTFGVMFAARPEAAAAELARVCKQGGRMGLTTWFPQSTIFEIFKVMKPYQPAPAPGAPAPPSPFAWGTRERMHELFDAAFDLRFETGTTYYRAPDGAAAWELFVQCYGPTKTLAALLDPDRREALQRDFEALHDGYRTELGVQMPREYLVTVGTRK